MKFYVDTCIYLNLWMKESSREGFPWWKYTEEFLERAVVEGSIIYYSIFVLRELDHIMSKKDFDEKKSVFESSIFKSIVVSDEDLKLARKTESEVMFEISFYDIMHLILSKKLKAILVTRDRKLLQIAKKYGVVAKKPEDFL